MESKSFRAKYRGWCSECGFRVFVGEEIVRMDVANPLYGPLYVHATCTQKSRESLKRAVVEFREPENLPTMASQTVWMAELMRTQYRAGLIRALEICDNLAGAGGDIELHAVEAAIREEAGR